MKKSHKLLAVSAVSLTLASALCAQVTLSLDPGKTFNLTENFEGYTVGEDVTANRSGTFNIVGEAETPGGTQAASFNAITTQQAWSWAGNADTVTTISFGFYKNGYIGGSNAFIYALNQAEGSLLSGTSNLVRFAGTGTHVLFNPTSNIVSETQDSTVTNATAWTLHTLLNTTDTDVAFAGDQTLLANSVQLWKENSAGEITLVSSAVFTAGLNLDNFGFATPSNWDVNDILLIDNVGYYDGIALVPEPSTFAMLAGLLALGLVIVRRRIGLRA